MSANDHINSPRLLVVMGVSGCGKSTLGSYLAERYSFRFLEADDFHSTENKAHMASGKPLTDAMREPWITALCEEVKNNALKGDSSVLAYSGLRRAHRQRFRELGLPVLFLHLAGPKEVILGRMQARSDHFMPASLLDSQYSALEPTNDEKDILNLDLTKEPAQIIADAIGICATFVTPES